MTDILTDRTTPALVAAIKANLFEWFRYVGRAPKVELHDSPEVTWLMTGFPHAFTNTVLRTQAAPDHADAIIERTLAHARSKNVTKLSWWVEPDTLPADLGRYLTAHCLTHMEGSAGMAADLAALNEELTTPAGLTIEHVTDTETLRAWAYASVVGFGYPETAVERWLDVFTSLGFELPLRSYVGILDGEPVATSQLFLAAGVAGIYVVVTLPAARRQGIGAAMTLAPLREARARGYRIAILHASPLGLGVYRRLGFREYCRMGHYAWAEETGE